MIGQGLETSLAQLVADQLGVALERVRIVAGDSDLVPYSSAGAIASRSMVVAGGALVLSSGQLRTKIAEIAAHRLEADPQDIVLADGVAHVRGTPARSLAFDDIAKAAWLGWDLPPGVAPGLEESATYDPPDITYSYATHAAQVAVDVETGIVEIERYVVAHDCGVVVNPMIADGQIQGGVAQGLGIATLEEVAYDEDGQPSVSTYLDYLLPLSNDVPTVEIRHLETPSPHTPGGMKGLGEGGMIPAPAAVGNAVAAALPEIAGKLLETPITPSRIVELLAAASVDGSEGRGAAMSAEHSSALRAEAVSKQYTATTALDAVDFDLSPGEVHGLVGENGAGKSTLVKVLTGVTQPTGGRVTISDEPIVLASPRTAAELGIAVVHQDNQLFEHLRVWEHLAVSQGRPTSFVRRPRRSSRGQGDLRSPRRVDRRRRDAPEQLAPTERKVVEIARALARSSRFLLLDEPTAALDPTEAQRLATTIRRLADHGTGVVLVSHHLEEVITLADRVTVLRDGRNAGSFVRGRYSERELVTSMIGTIPATPEVRATRAIAQHFV